MLNVKVRQNVRLIFCTYFVMHNDIMLIQKKEVAQVTDGVSERENEEQTGPKKHFWKDESPIPWWDLPLIHSELGIPRNEN